MGMTDATATYLRHGPIVATYGKLLAPDGAEPYNMDCMRVVYDGRVTPLDAGDVAVVRLSYFEKLSEKANKYDEMKKEKGRERQDGGEGVLLL